MSSTASRLADLAGLLRDKTPEGRRALLACVTDLYLSGSENCSDETRDGFGLLLADIARIAGPDAQQALAQSLADDQTPPASVVDFLLEQPGWVAAPFLAATQTLDDKALTELVDLHAAAHAASIAQRQGLSSVLVRKILTTGNDAALVSLAENHDAPLQRADFETLKAAAPALPHLQAALVDRNDLPADVAVGLMWHIGPHLGRHALDQALAVTTDALALAIEAAAAIGMSEGKATPHPEEAASYAVQKHSRRELKEPLVVRLLRDGDMDRFYACLDKLTDIDRATGEAIMAEKSGFALMVACRAAGFARSTFSTLVRLGENGAQRSTEQTFDLMSAFERLDDASAERLLGFWQVLFAGAGLLVADEARDTRAAG
ncbi:MAG: DUF2336 domain-containing protein [Pseudomonadota bacterium]